MQASIAKDRLEELKKAVLCEDMDEATRIAVQKFCDKAIEIVGEEAKIDWIPSDKWQPKNEKPVLVALTHTYESDYVAYGLARYLTLADGEKYWYENNHGYLECEKYSDGKGGSSLYKVSGWYPFSEYRPEKDKKITNADRIRAMSDEELAAFLNITVREEGNNMFTCDEYVNTPACRNHPCCECGAYLEWLQSTVED